MKFIIAITVFILIGLVGCDGGGDSSNEQCNFDFNSILNGIDAQQATSQWSCQSDDGQIFILQAFLDGTGFSTALGAFTFQQTGCTSADFQIGEELGSIFDIVGSIQSGILTFTLVFDTGLMFNVGCVLQIF